LPHRKLALGVRHQRLRGPAPVGNRLPERAAFLSEAAMLQPIPVAGRRPYAWMPDILRAQHLDR
jgi:hypothetical protein